MLNASLDAQKEFLNSDINNNEALRLAKFNVEARNNGKIKHFVEYFGDEFFGTTLWEKQLKNESLKARISTDTNVGPGYLHYNAEADLDINDEHIADIFESLDLENPRVRTIFEHDLNGEKDSENFLLVLPAGKSAHIEAGIAYGLGKKCYAIGEYDVTDSLYLIFDKIFKDENELFKERK